MKKLAMDMSGSGGRNVADRGTSKHKETYIKPIGKVILNGEKQCFPSKIRNKARMSPLTTSIQSPSQSNKSIEKSIRLERKIKRSYLQTM